MRNSIILAQILAMISTFMSQERTWRSPAIVIKRSNSGESDRTMTLLTFKHGKIMCVAKGARKLHSSKRGFLEPGMLIEGYFVKTKSWPILTQVKIIDELSEARATLPKIKQLSQVLEIFDRLFVEEEINPQIFTLINQILKLIALGQPTMVKKKLDSLLVSLGYPTPQEEGAANINDLVAQLTDKKMTSWKFLTVSNDKQAR